MDTSPRPSQLPDAADLLEPVRDPEVPQESEAYRREQDRREWEENRPPHYEDR